MPEIEGKMTILEISAPRGSMRLAAFPSLEEFKPDNQHEYQWLKMTGEQKADYYRKQKHRCLQHQCQGIKAFMRQHKRRNGHN